MLKKFISLIGVLLILSISYPSIINASADQEMKILFKVDSKTVSIYENNEERKVDANYPVIIKNSRSMVETIFF